jgi:hypothetical protein
MILHVVSYFYYRSVHLLYRKERMFASLVLFLILGKLIWENTFGESTTAELIGSPVLVEAHLLGVIWGSVIAALYLIGVNLFDE